MNRTVNIYSKNKISNILMIILLLLFALPNQIYAQLNRSEIIGAYVYNFAKNTEIKDAQNLRTYNIGLISENELIIKEFQKIATNFKINKKSISITIYNNSDIDYKNICLIFITNDKSAIYPEVFHKTKNQQILLVSENYSDKRKVMLNLYDTEDGKILFEINKGNIYNRKIQISDELILLGGTEIDVVKLYIESQKQLNKAENDFKNLQSKALELNSHYSETQNKAIFQQKQIEEQQKQIENQKGEEQKLLSEIERHQKELQNHLNEIEHQQKMLINEKTKLLIFSDSLTTSKTILKKQKDELNEGINKLKILKDEIRTKNREVKVQESTLGEQYSVIKNQKKVNSLLIIITILGAILFISLLIGFIFRKKKNATLRKQKEEIESKNILIKDNLEKKKLINNLLKSNNEELTTTIEKLKNTQEQLVQAEKMASLGILTAGIAHEINNPINFIYAGINSLQKDFNDIEIVINKIKDLNIDDENLKPKIEKINTLKKEYYFDEAVEAIPQTMADIRIGAERTAEIVDGLRKFSRIGENKFIQSDIHEYIQTALLMLKSKYKDVIKIVRNYDDNLPSLFCNPGKITQVFMNIIYNAIDAINEKGDGQGKIVITSIYEYEKIRISIKDNGTGIKENVIKKMFDPFYTTKDVGKGTGLGLSISYGIIEEHKGEIKVNSEKGKGTEFIIILPIKN